MRSPSRGVDDPGTTATGPPAAPLDGAAEEPDPEPDPGPEQQPEPDPEPEQPAEPDPEPEQPAELEHNRLRDLVSQVAMLEGKIDELAEASAQPARRSGAGVVVSASVALVLAAGLVLGAAHPALTAAVAAAWSSVVGGAPQQ
nr:hypothetical protein [Actinomycetota bacterium]